MQEGPRAAYTGQGSTASHHYPGPVRTFAIVVRGLPVDFRELHKAAEDLGLQVIYEQTSDMKLFINERPF